MRHHRELAFALEASSSRFEAVSRQSEHPLLSSCLTWEVLKTHYLSFWLELKFPSSRSAAVLCSPAQRHGQARPGLLLPRDFHRHPRDSQKMALAPWPPGRMGPLLKFTCSWFRIASRFRGKGELAMPVLEQKGKNHGDLKGSKANGSFKWGLRTHPRGKLVTAAWSWACCGFPLTLGNTAAFRSGCGIAGRRGTGESTRFRAWWFGTRLKIVTDHFVFCCFW